VRDEREAEAYKRRMAAGGWRKAGVFKFKRGAPGELIILFLGENI